MSAAAPGLEVAVRVPGSSANLGPGFDTVALAVGLYDEYALSVTEEPGLRVQLRGAGADVLPRDETHLVARAAAEAVAVCGGPWAEELAADGLGLRLECANTIPMSAGLGSSAAAVVGGWGLGFALTNALTREAATLSPADLAVINTRTGVWEGHPDNSSASVYGGLTLSWRPSVEVVRTATMTLHPDIEPVVLVPHSDRLSTATARAVLAPTVPHGDAVRQAGRAALLVHALTTEPALLLDGTSDWLHQEQRRSAYPATMAAVDALRDLGQAAVVSGAGPSVLVLSRADMVEDLAAEVRSWGRGWHMMRPGVAERGLDTYR
ncbi:MAG TPA: homoserine kinase [Ornithinimicrobium sp.]|uniref:homoserine kinase n=1 Tax=Ornithinimicrobium sp. TaxID=1977084 RepID=UPI002B468DBF|nr:homoserine kinase [Ornithinimicrobium sp.]HKJ12297.1 homoserine kinase [Ornithinimicrobium sp.]